MLLLYVYSWVWNLHDLMCIDMKMFRANKNLIFGKPIYSSPGRKYSSQSWRKSSMYCSRHIISVYLIFTSTCSYKAVILYVSTNENIEHCKYISKRTYKLQNGFMNVRNRQRTHVAIHILAFINILQIS